MNYRLILGYLLAAAIGIVCRIANIPLPAPPALVGALVVVSMTTGYILMNKVLIENQATQTEHFGGPQI